MKNLLKSAQPSLVISLLLFFLFSIAASAAYASGDEGGHEASKWWNFGWKTFDFIVLVGFLYWLLAAKVKEFFVGRRKDIKESLENAAKQKNEAEKKYREYSEKIDKASLEIDSIFEMIKEQGFAEKQKIIDDAKKVAEKMKRDAQARIEQELQKASSQLRIEAVQLSVQMAEQILKRNITEKDHESMVKEYMDKVVSKD
jgi:F-type H+-transporting ATPase subunit b